MSLPVRRSWLAGGVVAVAIGLWWGCLTLAQEAPTEKPAPKAPTEKPAGGPEDKTPPTAKADPFAVPQGSPADLIQFLQDLRKQKPEGRDTRSQVTFLRKISSAMITATEKILASAEATPQQKTIAARARLQALLLVTQLPIPKAERAKVVEALKQMPGQFTALGLADLARRAEGAVLQNELHDAAAGTPGSRPLDQVIEAIKQYVAQKPDQAGFAVASGVVMQLDRMGKAAEATALCDQFVALFSKSPDERVAKLVKKLEGIGRRLRLLGNTMEITGKTFEGQPFDWGKYRGKVVLVQFWASWCGPCKAELPNVEHFYQLYHDRGFDVVGISWDRKAEDLKKFLDEKKLPWTILYNGDNPDPGADKFPNFTYYGITGIPAMFLLDKEGKVVSLHARGPALGEELQKLLGPLPKTEEKDSKAATESKEGAEGRQPAEKAESPK